LAISTGDEIFFEISAIASGLNFSTSETGTESDWGKTNPDVLLFEFLHEKPKNTISSKNITLPCIYYEG
jgi:hypothetical protein